MQGTTVSCIDLRWLVLGVSRAIMPGQRSAAAPNWSLSCPVSPYNNDSACHLGEHPRPAFAGVGCPASQMRCSTPVRGIEIIGFEKIIKAVVGVGISPGILAHMQDTDTKVIRPPSTLGERGRTAWRKVVDAYTLTPPELELLRVACTALDQLHRIELAIKGSSSMTTKGSAGQLVGHPLLTEWRLHAESVRRICQQLNLPDLMPLPVPAQRKARPARVAHLTTSRGA